jgi:hypothetical protein
MSLSPVRALAALCCLGLLAACETDLERAAGGAVAGAVIANATGNNAVVGAVVGGAAGAACDDVGLCR